MRGSVRAEGPGAVLEQKEWSQGDLKQCSWAEKSKVRFHGGWVLWGEMRAKLGECPRLCLFTTDITTEGPGSDFVMKINSPYS